MIPERNIYNWKLVEIFPIESLEQYKDHHRLKVFYKKGLTCALCGKVHGSYLGAYKDSSGGVHIDVYSSDHKMMNVDHIVPKSLGGKSNIDNLQPSCEECNAIKGNGFINNVSPWLNAIVLFKKGAEHSLVEKHPELLNNAKVLKLHKKRGKGVHKLTIELSNGEILTKVDKSHFKIIEDD